jgi:hypothetical protein
MSKLIAVIALSFYTLMMVNLAFAQQESCNGGKLDEYTQTLI